MRWLVDLVYLLMAVATSPVWLARMIRTGKIHTDWRGRFGGGEALPRPNRPRVLLHAVSVGEVNAIRLLVDHLASGDDDGDGAVEVVVATTTDTGFARARTLFGATHPVVRYPLDFSFAVRRFLRRVRPGVVTLVELEVWPNFTARCAKEGVAVCVVNGRLTARSAARYDLIHALVRPSFGRIGVAAVQTEAYAERFRKLGVRKDRVRVTGTMKWDTAEIADKVPGAAALAEALGIDRSRPLVVAGSTAREEHALIRDAVPDGVQLLCAPRRPEWFDDAAAALPGCVRRSRGASGSATGRFLLDTIGELRAAYALADLVVVGRSFGALHGSDMMEPVALGKATIVGPAVTDFEAVVEALRAGDGIVQTDASSLATVIAELLDDPDRRRRLAANGRAVIRAQQGATARNVAVIREVAGVDARTGKTAAPA